MRQPIHTMTVTLALAILTVAAGATSRMGDADVREKNGAPCFTVTAQEEKRTGALHLMALNVYDMSTKPVVTVWSFGMSTDDGQPISSKTCVRYGHAPSGASGSPAAPLQAGKLYQVFLNAKSTRRNEPTFGYSARFCLLVQPDGKATVHRVVYQDGWRDEACYRR